MAFFRLTHAAASGAAFLLALGVSAATARAELLRGPYDNPSPIALEAQVGLYGGLGGYTPGGFHIAFDYTHRFARYGDGRYGLWFFGNLGGIVGPGPGVCARADGGVYECSGIGYGSGLLLKAGVQLTFRTSIPLVPFVRGGVGVAGVFARDVCEDSGAGVPLLVLGGGARYHFTKHLAAGVHTDLHVGPGFYGAGKSCFPASHNELWRGLSFLGSFQYTL